jgi:hypothetical protein
MWKQLVDHPRYVSPEQRRQDVRGWYTPQGLLRGSDAPIPGRCGRKLKRTDPPRYCMQRPLKGRDACGNCGGLTPRGPASPHAKHLKYSKVFPRDMRAAYQRVTENPELLQLREDVASLVVQQHRILDRISESETPPWGQAVEAFNDFKTAKSDEAKQAALKELEKVIRTGAGATAIQESLWNKLNDLSQQKETLVTAERNWLVKLRTMYTAEQGLAVMWAVRQAATEALAEHPDLLSRYIDRLEQLMPDPDLKRVEAVEE